MPSQVRRFKNVDEYSGALDQIQPGEPVSERIDDFYEALAVRDKLRKEDPEHYYNLVHFTGTALLTAGEDDERDDSRGEERLVL